MCVNNICRTCKHWMAYGDYVRESDYPFQTASDCRKIRETIEIDVDQGGGWDSGGARVEAVNTPPHFGCNHWEHWKPA